MTAPDRPWEDRLNDLAARWPQREGFASAVMDRVGRAQVAPAPVTGRWIMRTAAVLGIAACVTVVALLVSNVFLILVHVIACRRRGLGDLAGWSLLMPFYWVLISIGAWKGFLQLLTRPFYWEKTRHGLTGEAPPGEAPAASPPPEPAAPG